MFYNANLKLFITPISRFYYVIWKVFMFFHYMRYCNGGGWSELQAIFRFMSFSFGCILAKREHYKLVKSNTDNVYLFFFLITLCFDTFIAYNCGNKVFMGRIFSWMQHEKWSRFSIITVLIINTFTFLNQCILSKNAHCFTLTIRSRLKNTCWKIVKLTSPSFIVVSSTFVISSLGFVQVPLTSSIPLLIRPRKRI